MKTRRELLKDAAIKKGWATDLRVNMRRLSEETGLSTPTLYKAFDPDGRLSVTTMECLSTKFDIPIELLLATSSRRNSETALAA